MPASAPVLKHEKEDGAYVLEAGRFFTEHGDMVKRVRDALVVVLYALIVVVVGITTWLKLQTGEFPFNVEPFARTAYSPGGWPAIVFVFVLVGFLLIVVARLVFISFVENQIGELVENGVRGTGAMRKLDVRPPSS